MTGRIYKKLQGPTEVGSEEWVGRRMGGVICCRRNGWRTRLLKRDQGGGAKHGAGGCDWQVFLLKPLTVTVGNRQATDCERTRPLIKTPHFQLHMIKYPLAVSLKLSVILTKIENKPEHLSSLFQTEYKEVAFNQHWSRFFDPSADFYDFKMSLNSGHPLSHGNELNNVFVSNSSSRSMEMQYL